MCGIAGIFGTPEISTLEAIVSSIAHRGPDDRHLIQRGDVVLGHARLSILDISENGRQPMSNPKGTVWITYNGEVYNAQSLREELQKKGYRFRSTTDTEVVLHLYEEHGPNFVRMLDGMFALAIYDSRNNTLVLARDRLGIKPLYYTFSEKELKFASEQKALLWGQNPVLPSSSLDAFFGEGSSLFEGINEIKPGHLVVADRKGTAISLSDSSYYSLNDAPQEISEADAIRILASLLETSVQQHLVSDRPVGLYLTGGLDSSLLAAIAKKYYQGQLVGFCVGSEEKNEFALAQSIGKQLGIEVVTIPLSQQAIMDTIPQVIYHLEDADPRNVEFGVMHYFLAKTAAERGVRVVLSGEGADELFLGYDARYDHGRFTARQLLERMHCNHLRTQDRTAMAHGVEVRVPYLDNRELLEFALSLPPELKGGDEVDKHILRKVARQYLPEEVASRQKGYGHVESGVPFAVNTALGLAPGGTLERRFGYYQQILADVFKV
ncbi:asparagine synthase (glutamine-hydrolyzing) [Candidatus Woesearchaeota archaeon]|nr:asparagine synthase (glutamine-hydrolyzing) [Candidatus Woesearchaeota archaeon]